MAATPVAPRHGTDIERHFQAVAVVEVRTAHLGVIPRLAEVTQTPFGIGFKAATTEDHRFRAHRLQALRRAHHHTADPTTFILRQLDHGMIVTNINADLFTRLEPGLRQANPFVDGADDGTHRPFHLALDLDTHHRLRQFKFMPAGVLQPAHRIPRLVDQYLRQHRIGAAVGDAHQIVTKILRGIRLHTGVKTRVFFFDVRYKTIHIAGLIKDVTENSATEMRIAAALLARCLLQQHNAFCAGLTCRHRGRKSGVTASHNDYIETAHRQPP